MNNFLFINTPQNEFQNYYGQVETPFEKDQKIVTQLPKNITAIRSVAYAIFTALAGIKFYSTIFFWPVVLAGIAFVAWTIYSHFLSKDSLMEVFYKISGGKAKFESLPEIKLDQVQNKKTCEIISKINWDHLTHPICKTKTLDGRMIVIVKGLTRNNEGGNCQTKCVLAFVEKVGPEDLPRQISNVSELIDSIIYAIFLPQKGNSFYKLLSFSNGSSGNNHESHSHEIFSSITPEMANEFYAQKEKLI